MYPMFYPAVGTSWPCILRDPLYSIVTAMIYGGPNLLCQLLPKFRILVRNAGYNCSSTFR